MRIMYFAFEGFDNPNGTNRLALDMMNFLLNSNIEVYLLTSHSTGIDPDIPIELQGRKGFTYDIVKKKNVDKKKFVSRYIEGIKYAFQCTRYWEKEMKHFDLVILQSTPTVFISSILLHLKCPKPIIYNLYDIFPDGPYGYGAIKNKKIFFLLKKAQKFVYKFSYKIIVISEDMKKTLVLQGVPENKLVLIRNWYNDTEIQSVLPEDNKFLKKYNLSTNKFYIQYAGNFGYTFQYKLVLEVASLLKNKEDIVFHMIGSGAFETEFKNSVLKMGLTNIEFFPWQPLEIISDVYSACDISFIPLSRNVIKNSYPSKGALLMACGKAIVCATEKDSAFFEIMNTNNIGVCVSNRDAEECANAILDLLNNSNKLSTIGKNAAEYAKKEFSSSVNMNRIYSLLSNCIESFD